VRVLDIYGTVPYSVLYWYSTSTGQTPVHGYSTGIQVVFSTGRETPD
jgi:hypothetical protein